MHIAVNFFTLGFTIAPSFSVQVLSEHIEVDYSYSATFELLVLAVSPSFDCCNLRVDCVLASSVTVVNLDCSQSTGCIVVVCVVNSLYDSRFV